MAILLAAIGLPAGCIRIARRQRPDQPPGRSPAIRRIGPVYVLVSTQTLTTKPLHPDLLLEEGVPGLPGAPFTIPLRSAGASGPFGEVVTEGEKAGEGSFSVLLGSVKVISGTKASAIFFAVAPNSAHNDDDDKTDAPSIVCLSRPALEFCARST